MFRSNPFSSAPLWRPVTAYVVGVVSSAAFTPYLSLVIVAVGVVLALLFRRKRILGKITESLLFLALFFAIGMGWAYFRLWSMPAPFSSERTVYECTVVDTPRFKGKTWRCLVDVDGRMDSVAVDNGSRAMLYLYDSLSVAELKAGDRLLVRTSMSLPENNSGYRDYLLRNRICSTGYVPAGEVHFIGNDCDGGLVAFANRCRESVRQWYGEIGFSGDALAVLSALTLGVKDDISDDLREDYSVAGVSHVLALSGLHVGLIFLILNTLFYPLRLLPGGHIVRWGVITVLLFFYAVFTGLSPSVIRACFMMSALGFSQLIGRGKTSLNTLFLIALILLVYDPMYVYNISFLMSFAGVFAILVFYPLLSSKFRVRNTFLRYIIDMLLISSVAQIGVAPIVAWCFGSFSVYGVISSMIIVPLLTVLMYVILLLFVCCWIPQILSFVVVVTGWGLEAMNAVASFFSNLPFASFHGLNPLFVDIVLFYFISVVCLLLLVRVAPLRIRLLLGSAAVWLVLSCIDLYRQRGVERIVFKSAYPVAECRYEKAFDTFAFDSDLSDTTSVSRLGCMQVGRLAYLGGCSIWRIDYPLYYLPVGDANVCFDYLWLCRGVKGSLLDMKDKFTFGNIVIDSSLSDFYEKRFLAEADSLGLGIVNLKRNENHVIDLKCGGR